MSLVVLRPHLCTGLYPQRDCVLPDRLVIHTTEPQILVTVVSTAASLEDSSNM